MNFKLEIAEVILELQKILQKPNAIVFTGPGISVEIGYPDWKQLVKKLRENISNINWININQLAKESPILQSEVIRSLDKKAYYNKIFEIFNKKKEKNYSSYHLNLLRWPIRGIVTINFDNCFEDAYKKLYRKNPFSFSYYESKKFNEVRDLDNKFIFHLHGHIQEQITDKVIFTKSDYVNLYEGDKYQQCLEWLNSLFLDLRLIFIGFSLNDLHIMNFPKWFPQIFKENDFLHIALLQNSEMNKSNLIKITETYKIKPLYFPVVNNDFRSLKRIIFKCTVQEISKGFAYNIDRQSGLAKTKTVQKGLRKKLPEPPKNFIGRNNEISQIQNFIFSEEQNVLLVQGAPGIGKSSLIINSIKKIANATYCIFYHSFVDNYDFIDFINEVCNECIGHQYIYQNWSERLKAFLSLYGDLPIVIVIDDFEKTLNNTNTFMINEVIKFLELMKNIESQIKLILISQVKPAFNFNPLILMNLKLFGLKQNEIKLWLDHCKVNLPDNIFEEWYSLAGGNLKHWEILLAMKKKYTFSQIKKTYGEQKLNIDKLLRQTIKNLKDKSLELLEIFSAANTYIKAQVIKRLQESSKKYYEGINDLLNHFLVKNKHADDAYEIHNIIKTYVYENMPIDKKQKAHSFLAESYFNTLINRKQHDIIYFSYVREIVDHCNKSSNYNLALKALELFFNDYPRNCDAKSILEFFYSNEELINQTSEKTKLNALLIKADYEGNFGNLSRSIKLYETALEEYSIEPLKRCDIFLKLTDMNTKQRNLEKAEKYLSAAEFILNKYSNIYLVTRFNLLKGNWLRQKDSYKSSKEYYLKNITNSEIRNNIKTQAPIAETYRALANLNSHLMEYKEAKNNYKQAINIFNKINEQMGISTCFHSLASTFRKLGDNAQSIFYFKKSIETKENLGDIYGMARCHIGFSKTYRDMGKFEEAIEHLELAHKYKKNLNDEEGIAIDYMIRGTIYEKMEHDNLALENYENSLKYFKKLEVRQRIAEVHHTIATFYEKRKKLKLAIEEFEKASEYYESINDNIRRGLCLYYAGSIYYKICNFTDSANKLEKCIALLHGYKVYLSKIICAYIQMGFIYHKKKDYENKAYYLNKVKELLKKENSPELINEVLNNCENIFTINNLKTIKKLLAS